MELQYTLGTDSGNVAAISGALSMALIQYQISRPEETQIIGFLEEARTALEQGRWVPVADDC